MKEIYQLWQVWEDNGDEFLMGTYLTDPETEKEKLENKESGNYQYIIKKEEVKE